LRRFSARSCGQSRNTNAGDRRWTAAHFGAQIKAPTNICARNPRNSGIFSSPFARMITEFEQAETILRAGDVDFVALARGFLYDPRWPWHTWIDDLVDGIVAPMELGHLPYKKGGPPTDMDHFPPQSLISGSTSMAR
jgi:hypothetical protein